MIVTLSREGGVDSTPILQKLKERFSILDTDTLQDEKEKYHYLQFSLERFDEHNPRFRDLWSLQKDCYLYFLRSALYHFIAEKQGLIYGHGAAFILSDLPGVMKIKLVAPEEYRIEAVMKQNQIEYNEAKRLIHEREHERSGFHRFFFHADWNDDRCYDVVLNISSEGFEDTLDAVLKIEFSRDTVQERTRIVRNRVSEQDLSLKLLFEKNYQIDMLQVNFDHDGKTVKLRGLISNSTTQIDVQKEVEKEYPGYRADCEFEYIQGTFPYFPPI